MKYKKRKTKLNTYSTNTENDYVVFYIKRRNGIFVTFIIDKDDLNRVKEHNWHINSGRYVKNTNLGFLHQFIKGKKQGLMVDHKNGNIYDNRKTNLRHADNRQNQLNSKGKGYRFNKKSNKWVAYVREKKGVTKHLGSFETECLAKQARHDAEKKYYGEFANPQ